MTSCLFGDQEREAKIEKYNGKKIRGEIFNEMESKPCDLSFTELREVLPLDGG